MAQLGVCQPLIYALTQVAPDQLGASLLNEGGTLKAITSNFNQGGVIPTPDKGSGMVSREDSRSGPPIVKIRNYQRSNTPSKTTQDCVAENPITPNEVDFTLTQFLQRDVSIPLELMNELCGEADRVTSMAAMMPGGINARNLMSFDTGLATMEVRDIIYKQCLLPLFRDMNTAVLTKAASLIGNNVANGLLATPKPLPLFDANGDLRQQGHAILKTDMIQNAFMGAPIVVGSTDVLTYGALLEWGCCNNAGANFEKMEMSYPIRPFYDYAADTVLGPRELLVFAPEMLKFAQFSKNKYRAFQGKKVGTSEFGWLVLPEFNGVELDVQIKEIDCDSPRWDIFVRATFDVWGAGNTLYEAGDRLEGVNGVFNYVVTA